MLTDWGAGGWLSVSEASKKLRSNVGTIASDNTVDSILGTGGNCFLSSSKLRRGTLSDVSDKTLFSFVVALVEDLGDGGDIACSVLAGEECLSRPRGLVLLDSFLCTGRLLVSLVGWRTVIVGSLPSSTTYSYEKGLGVPVSLISPFQTHCSLFSFFPIPTGENKNVLGDEGLSSFCGGVYIVSAVEQIHDGKHENLRNNGRKWKFSRTERFAGWRASFEGTLSRALLVGQCRELSIASVVQCHQGSAQPGS